MNPMLTTLLFSIAVAISFSAIAVLVLGWRRHPAAESFAMSGLILFLILFLALWAGSMWLAPAGPAIAGAPLVAMIVMATIITLLILAATPRHHRHTIRLEPGGNTEAPRGIDIALIMLLALLLAVALAGSLQ
jgi:hypothetical protein